MKKTNISSRKYREGALDKNLITKMSKIRLLACDFDGIMTNGKVYVDKHGNEMVCCSRKDSLGINLLKRNNIEVVVITTEASLVVQKRCKKMNIQCWQKIESSSGKLKILKKLMKKGGLKKEEVAYMGDDINDIKPLKFANVSFTVADASENVKNIANYTTIARGGQHAVREVCNLILNSKNINAHY